MPSHSDSTIEGLLGYTTEELAVLSEEELKVKFKDVLSLEPKPDSIPLILDKPKKPKKEKQPKTKESRQDKLKNQLLELEGLLEEAEKGEEDDEEE